MITAIYSRQSIDNRDSLSIDSQIEKCVALCTYKGKEYKVYTDRGYSGKNINRPAFTELMEDVKKGEIDEIVVYRLDRISRNLNDFTNMMQTLEKYNATFASATESFDTATPMGRAMTYLLVVFAQLERESITERIRDNAMYRATLGKWTGGIVPFGFSRVRTDGKTVLHHNDNSKDIIRIFEEYMKLDGSVRGTTYKANLLKIGGKVWGNTTISRILQNPFYATATPAIYDYFIESNYTLLNEREDFDGTHGVMYYRARENDERRRKGLKEQEQFVIIGEHKGIIDGDMWVQCQAKMNHNKGSNARPNAGKISWLTGLVKCEYCGTGIGIFWSETKKQRHNYFKCRHKMQNGKFLCPNKTRKMEVLEKFVFDEIKNICQDKEFLKKMEDDIIIQKFKPLQDNSTNIISQIKSKGKEIQNLVNNLKKITSDSIISAIEREITALQADIEALRKEHKKIAESMSTFENAIMNKKFVMDNFNKFISEFDSSDVEQRKYLASTIIKNIIVGNDEIKINLFTFDI